MFHYTIGYLAALWAVSLATWETFWLEKDGERWFHYFNFCSNWMIILTTFYFLNKRYNTLAQNLSRYLWVICTVFSTIATIMYWSILHYSHRCNGWCLLVTINIHGAPLALLLISYVSDPMRYKVQKRDIIPVTIVGMLYHMYLVIYYHLNGKWIYKFMNIYEFSWVATYVMVAMCFMMIYILSVNAA